MRDRYGRKITYLRLSVTDRCNLRCVYCMPECGVPSKGHDAILTYEEMERLVRIAVRCGIERVRITGGEPLVRLGLLDFLARLKAIPGLKDLSLSTNAVLLPGLARDLKAAGVDRVNVSLDTLRPERFREIARRDQHAEVRRGLEAALEAGLDPVKINCVAIRGFNDDEFEDFTRLTIERQLHVRFIELMPLGDSHPWSAAHFIPASEVKNAIARKWDLIPADPVKGGGPARYYRIPGAAGTLGFITSMSEHFCSECNRVRLSADGKVNPCLGSLLETDLRTPLRAGASDAELQAIFLKAVGMKPREHQMEYLTEDTRGRRMSAIGG